MYKEDLALNNLQWLICHKTQPNLNKKVLIFLIYRITKLQYDLFNIVIWYILFQLKESQS